MDIIARHVWVTGRVQGVAFRHHAKVKAREIGLAGWVKNLDDGRVEVWVEGRPQDVAPFVLWLRDGPPAAAVESVEVREEAPLGVECFEVRRTTGV